MSLVATCDALDSMQLSCEIVKGELRNGLRVRLEAGFRNVVRKIQPPISPKLLVRDLYQPIRGDLKVKV